MNPSDAGFQDRYVVQEIIKEMAKNRSIDTKGKRGFKGTYSITFSFTYRTYVLWENSSGYEIWDLVAVDQRAVTYFTH